MDYSIKETCCWEPQGNGCFLTRCGHLHAFERHFSPTKTKTCPYCKRPFDDATYLNVQEAVPNRAIIQQLLQPDKAKELDE